MIIYTGNIELSKHIQPREIISKYQQAVQIADERTYNNQMNFGTEEKLRQRCKFNRLTTLFKMASAWVQKNNRNGVGQSEEPADFSNDFDSCFKYWTHENQFHH